MKKVQAYLWPLYRTEGPVESGSCRLAAPLRRCLLRAVLYRRDGPGLFVPKIEISVWGSQVTFMVTSSSLEPKMVGKVELCNSRDRVPG